ncbi:MAG: VPLPA-CTERM sorting domain-containing protein [Nitrospira sp.]
MMSHTILLAGAVLSVGIAGPLPASAAEFFSADFNANNGGFTQSTVNPLGASPGAPWSHGATVGVGGSGGWTAGPEEGQGNPVEHLLTSPTLSLPSAGAVSLSFDHRYSFEDGWDGGQVLVSINGGSFAAVPLGSFTQNGYSGTVQTRDDWGYTDDMNGLDVFTGEAATFGPSLANLGSLNAGDTVQVRFRGGWDWNGIGADPTLGWQIDNVALSVNPVPLPAALWLFGSGLVGLGAIARRKMAASA